MRITEIMTADVDTVDLDATIEEAAQVMSDADVGCVPIMEGGKVRGIVTDRDIVLRAVAEGLAPSDTPVTEV
ncbi:MAG: CBS domain-containing protein, partial [Elusimicrobiota bacterium]|nr:CBS domain-containing protein [Elusimicrobiota bacterium]